MPDSLLPTPRPIILSPDRVNALIEIATQRMTEQDRKRFVAIISGCPEYRRSPVDPNDKRQSQAAGRLYVNVGALSGILKGMQDAPKKERLKRLKSAIKVSENLYEDLNAVVFPAEKSCAPKKAEIQTQAK